MRLPLTDRLHGIGAAMLGRIAGLLLVLAGMAAPAGAALPAGAPGGPAITSQIAVDDAILTQPRHLARAAAAQDDPADEVSPPAPPQHRSDPRTTPRGPAMQAALRATSHVALPPARAPPVV